MNQDKRQRQQVTPRSRYIFVRMHGVSSRREQSLISGRWDRDYFLKLRESANYNLVWKAHKPLHITFTIWHLPCNLTFKSFYCPKISQERRIIPYPISSWNWLIGWLADCPLTVTGNLMSSNSDRLRQPCTNFPF